MLLLWRDRPANSENRDLERYDNHVNFISYGQLMGKLEKQFHYGDEITFIKKAPNSSSQKPSTSYVRTSDGGRFPKSLVLENFGFDLSPDFV